MENQNKELLKVELESLQEMAYDLSLTGFDEKELASYMGDDEKETQDDDFDPVSYTHLDVYKRQTFCGIRISMAVFTASSTAHQ